MDFFAIAFTLLLIMDPLGNIPLFMSAVKDIAPSRQRIVVMRELLIAYVIMTSFLFFGSKILRGLKLSQEAIAIAGAIVLFIISLRMVFPPQQEESVTKENKIVEEPLVVPLAVPLVAGPSLLATLILLVEKNPQYLWKCFGAMTVAWGISATLLISSSFFFRFLGDRGLKAIERLMGMMLISISIQMFLDALPALRKFLQ